MRKQIKLITIFACIAIVIVAAAATLLQRKNEPEEEEEYAQMEILEPAATSSSESASGSSDIDPDGTEENSDGDSEEKFGDQDTVDGSMSDFGDLTVAALSMEGESAADDLAFINDCIAKSGISLTMKDSLKASFPEETRVDMEDAIAGDFVVFTDGNRTITSAAIKGNRNNMYKVKNGIVVKEYIPYQRLSDGTAYFCRLINTDEISEEDLKTAATESGYMDAELIFADDVDDTLLDDDAKAKLRETLNNYYGDIFVAERCQEIGIIYVDDTVYDELLDMKAMSDMGQMVMVRYIYDTGQFKIVP